MMRRKSSNRNKHRSKHSRTTTRATTRGNSRKDGRGGSSSSSATTSFSAMRSSDMGSETGMTLATPQPQPYMDAQWRPNWVELNQPPDMSKPWVPGVAKEVVSMSHRGQVINRSMVWNSPTDGETISVRYVYTQPPYY